MRTKKTMKKTTKSKNTQVEEKHNKRNSTILSYSSKLNKINGGKIRDIFYT
jgi:hypothetical protein